MLELEETSWRNLAILNDQSVEYRLRCLTYRAKSQALSSMVI